MPNEVGEYSFELTSGKVLRATRDSAALDVFYAGSKVLWIGDRVTAIPTGVKSKFSPGLVAVIKEKSGLALKGIEIKAGVIDADYRDEWLVLARNPVTLELPFDDDGNPLPPPYKVEPSWKPFRLNPGDKIAQFVMVDLPKVHFYAMTGGEILLSETIRTGGFGSTDTHEIPPILGGPKAANEAIIPPSKDED